MRLIALAVVACGGSQIGEPARGVAVEVEIASITLDDGSGDQARLQLSLRSSDGKPTPIAVQRVELLDPAGATLALLPPREPMRWTEAGQFAPWNQVVGAGEILAATYKLDSAKWAKPDGHYDRSATYRVRVVVDVGGGTRTIEKRATVMPEAPIET
jgi:hypothetical protein